MWPLILAVSDPRLCLFNWNRHRFSVWRSQLNGKLKSYSLITKSHFNAPDEIFNWYDLHLLMIHNVLIEVYRNFHFRFPDFSILMIILLLSNSSVSQALLLNNGVFPKRIRNSVNSANSENLINHWSLNCAQFKDPVSQVCHAGTLVASRSLTQKLTGLSPFTAFVTEFNENI